MRDNQPPRFVRLAQNPDSVLFLVASIEMVPKSLVERFGKPSPGDGHKVSGTFYFADEEAAVFSIYDWKCTGCYNPACSPDEFWDLEEIIPLSFGSNSHNQRAIKKFLSWLDRALADGVETDQDWLARLSARSFSAEHEQRLLQLMENGGTKTQIAALDAIRRIGEPAATPMVLKQLLQLLHERQPIRPAAINALTAFAGLADVDWVQSYIKEQINSESADVRCNRLVAVTALGPKVWTGGVLARFAELLMEEPTAERALSCMSPILAKRGRTPPMTPEIVAGVAKQLESNKPSTRQYAAEAVRSLGKSAGVLHVLTPLFRMLGEPDWRSRISAEKTFEGLGQVAAIPELLPHLCECVRPEDFPVKASALRVARNIAKATADHGAGRRLARVIKGC